MIVRVVVSLMAVVVAVEWMVGIRGWCRLCGGGGGDAGGGNEHIQSPASTRQASGRLAARCTEVDQDKLKA